MHCAGVANPLAAAVALLGLAAGQLIVQDSPGQASSWASSSQQRVLAPVQGINHDASQQYREPSTESETPFKAGSYTRKKQHSSICPSEGETQWTGTIDVSVEHRLFYWFAESRNDPSTDPIVIWMNGGPGSSSMTTLFNEIGPCWLAPDANDPEPNPWSWNRNASVLFLDQPAGVGFSTVSKGGHVPSQDMDGAEDFQQFLNIFFRDVFPDLAALPIHVAAESYGGHYASTYVNYIIESRRYDSKRAFWGNITSLVLVDALVDYAATAVGVYELLCKDNENEHILNATECAGVANSLPELKRLARNCEVAYTGPECFAMQRFADAKIHKYYNDKIMAGTRSPYHLHKKCLDFPSCTDFTKGNVTRYLNLDHIKKSLGFESSFVFKWVNWEMNTAFANTGVPYKPVTHELAAILDAQDQVTNTDIRVLVLQGNSDYVINTPGNAWAYENLRWGGQAEFSVNEWKKLPSHVAATGKWKGIRSGKLAFVGIDGAGHTVPGDARHGALDVFQEWVKGGWKHR